MAQHSSKIYEFFGFTPGETPPISRIFNGANGNANPPEDINPQRPDTPTTAGLTDGHAGIQNGHPTRANGTPKHPRLRTLPPDHRDLPPPLRSRFRALIQDFGPLWFTLPLSTATLSLHLRLLPSPFHFPSAPTLSLILITLTLVLFSLFTLLFLTRLAWFRRAAYDEISSAAGEDGLVLAAPSTSAGDAPPLMYGASGAGFLFLPCWPATWLLIVAYAVLDAAEAQVGRRQTAFVRFAVVGWWVGAAWMVGVLFCVLGWLLSSPRAGRRTPGGRFARPVALVVVTAGLATVGWVGGLLGLELGGGEAVGVGVLGPVVVFSFCAVGATAVMVVMVFAVLTHELVLVTGWPPPEQTSNMFFLVAPLGMGSVALLYLGAAVVKSVQIVGEGDRGEVPTAGAAESVDVVCVLLGLFLVGMAAFWLALSFMTVVFRLSRRELQWNPTLNGVVFPVASLGIAMAQFGDVFQSRFFGIVSCVLLGLASVLFIVHLLLTLVHIFKGELLVVREDRRLTARLNQTVKLS
ncbi:voltage-dependent anion channel-domain-containing protein [Podospora aff. communis PSN243]|uniref:Voltage-dependent anion channel-domain-containing protein n=1 Tax=Podospora aff. communis PSN243 TaxID=3040156 RepID=A0AAV9GBJ0_9PEZI|nr:voltage-dependent anion channel-domain-containing protein [Podospora aff. communis PSN243]